MTSRHLVQESTRSSPLEGSCKIDVQGCGQTPTATLALWGDQARILGSSGISVPNSKTVLLFYGSTCGHPVWSSLLKPPVRIPEAAEHEAVVASARAHPNRCSLLATYLKKCLRQGCQSPVCRGFPSLKPLPPVQGQQKLGEIPPSAGKKLKRAWK